MLLEPDLEVKGDRDNCAAPWLMKLMDGPSQEPDKEKTMYEREERLIEEAERLAAAATASLPPTEKGARDASALSAIQQAITECESAKRMISSVYQTLTCRVPADRADVDQGRKELLPRAWTALLLVEREKDFLINDLYRLQSENRPNKR